MKINKVSIWHEVFVLVLYFFLSAFVFRCFYKGQVYGESAIIFFAIWATTLITLFISLPIIYFLKKKIDTIKIEFFIGLIPLTVSTFFNSLDNIHPFLLCNFIEIVILYSISIFYKLNKNEE
jgi:hypothetical protein